MTPTPIQNRAVISTHGTTIRLGIYSNARHVFPYDVVGAHDINVMLAMHNPKTNMATFLKESKYIEHIKKDGEDMLLGFSDFDFNESSYDTVRLFRVKGKAWSNLIITNEKQVPILVRVKEYEDETQIDIIDRNAKAVLQRGVPAYIDGGHQLLEPKHERAVDIKGLPVFFELGAHHHIFADE